MKSWKTKSGYTIILVLAERSNVFLLTNGQNNILIDTGPKRLWNKLDNRLKRLKIRHLDYLILTHSHFDHAGNAKRIKKNYHAKLMVHRIEAPFITSGESIIPDGTNIFTRTLINLFGKSLSSRLRFESCPADILIDSTFELREFGFNAYIWHTPGHTQGSMSIIIDNEIALVGDTMFGIFRGSVFPPYADDVPQMLQSWRKLLETGCSLFIPSHGSANSRALVERDYYKRINF